MEMFRSAILFSISGIPLFLRGNYENESFVVAAIMAVLINIPCNYLFIFSLNLGISGAAMASSLAEAGSLLILVIYTFLKMDKENLGLKPVYDRKLLNSLFHLSVWSMMHAFIVLLRGFYSSWLSSGWEKNNWQCRIL